MGAEYTKAQAKATTKYIKEKTDQIVVRVPKGQKDRIKEHADAQGFESVNAFITDCINERMRE